MASVGCEVVTADGYSPINLVADDPKLRGRGLRVEHFIRPPITISIELCIPVSVTCILLCPDLPPGAELKVELSGGGQSNGRQSDGRQSGGGQSGVTMHKLCAGPMVGTSGSLLVARTKLHHQAQQMASVVTLANLVVHSSVCKDLTKLKHVESPLRQVNVLRQLKNLQLRVTRWTGAKPVSIKWLEIWGRVSAACSRKEMTLFESKLKPSPSPCEQPLSMYGPSHWPLGTQTLTANNHPGLLSSLPSSSGVEKEVTASAQTQDVTSQEIPHRLLDELTFELMVLPVLLPSGHCVDQSTVDRLAHNDALYGRPPTDPFTGLSHAPNHVHLQF